MTKYKKSLFIFRRDLRLEDNTALIKALEESEEVICAFIFNPKQLENNEYRGDKLVQFMLTSLEELKEELKSKEGQLYFFYDNPIDIIKKLKKDLDINAVFFNKDYTPFSLARDKKQEEICTELGIDCKSFDDALLNPPQKVFKDDGKPYTVFTPYYKRALNYEIDEPKKNIYKNYFNKEISCSISKENILKNSDKNIAIQGGRKEAFQLLQEFTKRVENYKEERDFPEINSTSMLSAHNKFGTISPREIVYFLREKNIEAEPFIRQLYWRDFFTQIAYNFPHVFGKSFNPSYDSVVWEDNKERFKAWCEGKTGFPIVDAAMRELNETGAMHNRCRMVVASFLTKDLHIDWRLGEKYFAQKLIDYDPAVNNGSWQWASSTGCDAQPYFRIFNPWLQQKKFDANCVYIKKWVPELRNVDPKAIHELDKVRPLTIDPTYPKPIVDHQEEKEITLKYFKEK